MCPPLELDAGTESLDSVRQAAVYASGVLALSGNPVLRNIAERAAKLIGTPMAVVTILDDMSRWLPASVGVILEHVDQHDALYSNPIVVVEDTLCVCDLSLDPRFADHALVTGPLAVRFYAGASARSPSGNALGCVYALDARPRDAIGDEQRDALRRLAMEVVGEVDRIEHVQRYSAEAIAAITRLIDDAVRRGDDVEIIQLDRILQDLESSLANDLR